MSTNTKFLSQLSKQSNPKSDCFADVACNFLERTNSIGLNEAKECLDGTRTGILAEITDWINSKDTTTPPIFWLYGEAGRGKLAIAHTISLHAQNIGVLGSCFCFSHVRQHEELQTKLFLTIVHDLANHDIQVQLLLDEVVSKKYLSKRRANIVEEWQTLILEPLSTLNGSFAGNVVVVIDALDESGTESTRAAILHILAADRAELPANIRILVTSRPLSDIREALNTNEHNILARSLDSIDKESTINDIHLYVSTQLSSHGDTC